MAISEIPLTARNQTFSIALAGASYNFQVLWRDFAWVLDIANSAGDVLVSGVPLVTGVNLLGQYHHLKLGFGLIVACDDPAQEYPTKTDLGRTSHLYAVTE